METGANYMLYRFWRGFSPLNPSRWEFPKYIKWNKYSASYLYEKYLNGKRILSTKPETRESQQGQIFLNIQTYLKS